MRRYFTLRCIGMHLTLAILLPAFAALTIWQYDRATSGNTLSWAYTFEWPLFGGYAIYVWWQLIHDDPVRRRAFLDVDDESDTKAGAAGESIPIADVGDAAPARVRPEDVPGWALDATRRRPRTAAVTPDGGSAPDRSGSVGLAVDHGRDQSDPAESDPQLAAYNRYLAELRAVDAAPDARRRRNSAAR